MLGAESVSAVSVFASHTPHAVNIHCMSKRRVLFCFVLLVRSFVLFWFFGCAKTGVVDEGGVRLAAILLKNKYKPLALAGFRWKKC